MTEPTIGEIMRRLDDVSRQMLDLAKEMRSDRVEAATKYLPREIFNEARRADQADVTDVDKRVDDIQKEQTRNADWKRQMASGWPSPASLSS